MNRLGLAAALIAFLVTLSVAMLFARAASHRERAQELAEAVETGLDATRVLARQLDLLRARAEGWAASHSDPGIVGKRSWPETEERDLLTVHGAVIDSRGTLLDSCPHLALGAPWGFETLAPALGPRSGVLYSADNRAMVFVLTGPIGDTGARVAAAVDASALIDVSGVADLARRGFGHEVWIDDLASSERTLVHRWSEPVGSSGFELPVSSDDGSWTLAVSDRRRMPAPHPRTTRLALALVLALVAAGVAFELTRRWENMSAQLRVRDEELAAAGVRVLEETELRQRLVEQASFNAIHDRLTELPNQKEFVHRIERALGRVRTAEDSEFCVLILGLDRFSSVNETLGEKRGDALLTEVARRLDSAVRPGDTLARVGGDKFGLLLYGIDSEAAADASAKRILEVMATPFSSADKEVYLTASIGISLAKSGYEGAREVFRHAELAMYQAKATRPGCTVHFEPEKGDEVASVVQLETDLRRAIEREEFELHYQPIVATAGGELRGMEVLIRWNHPLEGTLAPGRFLPLAEDLGLMWDINRWVMRRTADQAVEWRRRFPDDPFYLSFNATASDLEQPTFYEYLGGLLDESGLPDGALRLEITEGMILRDLSAASKKLTELNDRGVWVLLDDFGTGYSSLSYLHQLPIHTLKIDRSFISHLGQSGRDVEIVRAIIDMASALRIQTIAEGIEDQETLEIMQGMRCDAVQGFYFSRPVPAAAAEQWLVDGQWPAEWQRSAAS